MRESTFIASLDAFGYDTESMPFTKVEGNLIISVKVNEDIGKYVLHTANNTNGEFTYSSYPSLRSLYNAMVAQDIA